MVQPDTTAFRIDPALAARFQLVRLLGAGGMGVVYEARDLERDEVVALKTLRSRDADSLYRFKREFRSLSGILHPNLVVLYELFAAPEDWAFTMELVRGTSLTRWLSPEGASAPPSQDEHPPEPDPDGTIRVPTNPETTKTRKKTQARWVRPAKRSPAEEARLRDALRQFARGLSALHESGHVHRDVKPSNVMVTHQGRVVVLDFGVIAELGPSTQRELHVVGTPAYMAPEQAAALEAPLPASDWYSFGLVLYELLTGRRPFLGDPDDVLAAKKLVPPPPITDFAPHAPPDLAELCHALLQAEPRRRPTGAAILAALGDETNAADVVRQSTRPGGKAFRPDRDVPDVALRERELAAVEDAFTKARSGKSSAVLVGGPSGFGKTTLVETFLDKAAAEGAIVLRGRCYARESVPYKALDTLVDALARWLIEAPFDIVEYVVASAPADASALLEAFPVLGRIAMLEAGRQRRSGGHTDETRRRAFRALMQMLQRLSAHRPLVLFVDDLQWGDLDSAPFFTALFAQGASRILFLGTYRDDEATTSPLLAGLRESLRTPLANVVEILLQPLPSEALTTIVRSVLGQSAPPSVVETIAGSARGSPYFALELARHARANQTHANRTHASSEDPAANPASDGSASVHSLLRARARRLSGDAQRLLEVVAVAGAAVDRAIVEEACDAEETTKPLLELVAGHFLKHVAGDRLDTRHDAVREAILSGLDAPAQRALHRTLARALERRNVDALDVHRAAQHYYLAFPDAEADRVFAACHEAAQRAAATHAYDQAFEHVERARRVAETAGLPVDDAFRRFAGQVATRTGQLDAAAIALTALLQAATDPLTRAQLRLARSRVLLARLDTAAALDEALAGVQELGAPPPRSIPRELASTVARITKAIARTYAPAREPASAKPDPTELERLETSVQLWFQYGLSGYFKLDRTAQFSSILRSIDIVLHASPSAEIVRWYAMCGVLFATLRLPRVSAAFQDAAERMAIRVGTTEAKAMVTMYRGHNLSFRGHPREAEKVMRECLETSGNALSNMDFHLVMSHLVGLLLARGHVRAGLACVDTGLERASFENVGQRLDNRHTYSCYRAVLLAMQGRADEGRPHLDSFERMLRKPANDWRCLHWLANRVMFVVESGAPEDVIEQAIADLHATGITPRTLPQQFRLAYAVIARHRVDRLDGSAHARRRFLDARRDLERCGPHPSFRTKLLRADAAFARHEGDRAGAARLLDAASALADPIDDRLAAWEIEVERARLATAPALARAHLDRAIALATEEEWRPRLAAVTALRDAG